MDFATDDVYSSNCCVCLGVFNIHNACGCPVYKLFAGNDIHEVAGMRNSVNCACQWNK